MAELPETRSPSVDAIFAAYEAGRDEERTYLGMSVIGDPCERKLWYGFRWASPPEAFGGRMLRLFQTGHLQEGRLVEDLRRAGCTVLDRDPETGEQFGVIAAGGHLRGHLDGIVTGVVEAPKVEHVLEAKTHNDRSFKALTKDGVAKAKPMHFAQMQGYMHLRGLTRALYIAVNKNDDDIYIERIDYDPVAALQIIARGERIIGEHRSPGRLHDDPSAKMAFVCRSCPALGVCHEGAFARRNCRTCLHATAELDGDGRWSCARLNRDLGVDEQRAGCPHHLYLPSLVPGEQVDADAEAETVTYRLQSGDLWTDGEVRP